MAEEERAQPGKRRLPHRWTPLLLVGFVGLNLVLQIFNGAWESDFGGHADEAAHVVTGLMVRDYLAGPAWRLESPLPFARDYYERFPKVALGHYPPGFYVVEGLWLLPSRSRGMILLLPVLLTSIAAVSAFRIGQPLIGWPAALAAALAFCFYRIVQTYTAVVMSDMLLAILCLLATVSFGVFLRKKTAPWSLAFGFLAAAAILTKGSGLLLALVPPIALVFSRQLVLLRNWRLWLAAIPVLLLAFPWMVATAGITAEGMVDTGILEYMRAAVPYYAENSLFVFGYVLTGVILVALVWTAGRVWQKPGLDPDEPVLWALLLAVFIFYGIVPSGLDERYLLPALIPALLLAVRAVQAGAGALSRNPTGAPSRLAFPAVLFFTCVFAWERHDSPDKQFQGSQAVVSALLEQKAGPEERLTLLVASDPRGEGSIIADALLRDPAGFSVQRGSKLLASTDWLGRDYEAAFSDLPELELILREHGIGYVVVDRSLPADATPEHLSRLHDLLGSGLNGFALVAETPLERRGAPASTMRIYSVPQVSSVSASSE